MVAGTIAVGVGVTLANVGLTFSVPLYSSLRLGAVTVTDLTRRVVVVVWIVAMVVVGASLFPFFLAHLLAGVATVAVTLALVGRSSWVLPTFQVAKLRPVLREAAPVGLSQAVGIVYPRVLVLGMSLLATASQTGDFATSYRILETFVALPIVMVGGVLPILAYAGSYDEDRLVSAMQRIAEVSLLFALLLVLLLAIGAEPLVTVVGGPGYAGAVSILQIQAFMLVGAFLAVTCELGLLAVRQQRALVTMNTVAMAVVLVLGGALIPSLGAKGAALAAVGGETALAAAGLYLLIRARPALRPRIDRFARLIAAAGIGGAVVLVPGLPPAVAAVVAALVYVATAYALGAVPRDLLHILRSNPATSEQ
jgi:O-antigen/teichoic acid export membrane protein